MRNGVIISLDLTEGFALMLTAPTARVPSLMPLIAFMATTANMLFP
jgi:hypothetical protein